MLIRRTRRLATAFLVVLSVLFSQLALAAYICPMQADAVLAAAMMSAEMPCAGMDAQQPGLCHEHANSAAQSPESAKVVSPGVAAVIQVLTVAHAVLRATPLPAQGEPATRPPPDPLFLSTLRLRV